MRNVEMRQMLDQEQRMEQQNEEQESLLLMSNNSNTSSQDEHEHDYEYEGDYTPREEDQNSNSNNNNSNSSSMPQRQSRTSLLEEIDEASASASTSTKASASTKSLAAASAWPIQLKTQSGSRSHPSKNKMRMHMSRSMSVGQQPSTSMDTGTSASATMNTSTSTSMPFSKPTLSSLFPRMDTNTTTNTNNEGIALPRSRSYDNISSHQINMNISPSPLFNDIDTHNQFDAFLSTIDRFEDEFDQQAYEELIPLQIRMALENQIFGWDHMYSAALGHVVPSVVAFWLTFWIVSLIGFNVNVNVNEGTGTGSDVTTCGDWWRCNLHKVYHYHSYENNYTPIFSLSTSTLIAIRLLLSLWSALNAFRTVRRRRKVWLLQYQVTEYFKSNTAAQKEMELVDRHTLLGRIRTRVHSRRNKRKNRKLMSKIDKAGRRFEKRDRRNVVRRRRDFQDGSAEFEVDHHRRVQLLSQRGNDLNVNTTSTSTSTTASTISKKKTSGSISGSKERGNQLLMPLSISSNREEESEQMSPHSREQQQQSTSTSASTSTSTSSLRRRIFLNNTYQSSQAGTMTSTSHGHSSETKATSEVQVPLPLEQQEGRDEKEEDPDHFIQAYMTHRRASQEHLHDDDNRHHRNRAIVPKKSSNGNGNGNGNDNSASLSSSPSPTSSPVPSPSEQNKCQFYGHTMPAFAMESITKDQIRFRNGLIQNVAYAHGGFFGAAPFMLANPHWINILRTLMPDVYVQISRRVVHAPVPQLIHWAENNPVVAAYGTAHELEYCGKIPTLEWDVFLDPHLVNRVECVCDARHTFLEGLAKKSKRIDTVLRHKQIERRFTDKMDGVAVLLDVDERRILHFYNTEIQNRVILLMEQMLIAHGNISQLALEQTGRMKQFNFSRIKRTQRTLGGGICVKQWIMTFTEALKMSTELDEDFGGGEVGSGGGGGGMDANSMNGNGGNSVGMAISMEEDEEYYSDCDSGSGFGTNLSSPGITPNSSLHNSRPQTPTMLGMGMGIDADMDGNSVTSSVRRRLIDKSHERNSPIYGTRNHNEHHYERTSTARGPMSSPPSSPYRSNLKNLSPRGDRGGSQNGSRSGSRSPQMKTKGATKGGGLKPSTSYDDLAQAAVTTSSIAECMKTLQTIMNCTAPLGLILDIKSRHVPKRVWALLLDALRDMGARVEGVGTFYGEDIRDISRYCATPVKECMFFHNAGDLQQACHDGRIRRGDACFFNGGSLFWNYPDLRNKGDYLRTLRNVCSIKFNAHEYKKQYAFQTYARVTRKKSMNSSSNRNGNRNGNDNDLGYDNDDHDRQRRTGSNSLMRPLMQSSTSNSDAESSYEDSEASNYGTRTKFLEGSGSTVQHYKEHYDLSIGMYIQEFAIDEQSIDMLVKYANENQELYDLGLSWGGVNGVTVRGIQPSRLTSTDGLWNQRYGGARWDVNLYPDRMQ